MCNSKTIKNIHTESDVVDDVVDDVGSELNKNPEVQICNCFTSLYSLTHVSNIDPCNIIKDKFETLILVS